MKLPWNSSNDSESNEMPTNIDQVIEQMPEDEKQQPILNFNGKRYDMKSLPEEIKDLLRKMRVAQQQVKIHEDTVKVLKLGVQTIGATLNNKLNDINPL